MLFEMHCHTSEHSPCSHVRAVDHVRDCMRRGLDGLVLTDHHYLWRDDEIDMLRLHADAPPEFVILTGQEVYSSEFDDLLVYGSSRAHMVGTPASMLRRRYPAAALVWAHPWRWGNRPKDGDLHHELLDGVEVYNGQQGDDENRYGMAAYRRLGLVGIAGSDAHFHDTAGRSPTRFERPVHTIAELAREIRAGRCRPASTGGR